MLCSSPSAPQSPPDVTLYCITPPPPFLGELCSTYKHNAPLPSTHLGGRQPAVCTGLRHSPELHLCCQNKGKKKIN